MPIHVYRINLFAPVPLIGSYSCRDLSILEPLNLHLLVYGIIFVRYDSKNDIFVSICCFFNKFPLIAGFPFDSGRYDPKKWVSKILGVFFEIFRILHY